LKTCELKDSFVRSWSHEYSFNLTYGTRKGWANKGQKLNKKICWKKKWMRRLQRGATLVERTITSSLGNGGMTEPSRF